MRVPAKLSEAKVAYTTFGTSQLSSVLFAYFQERLAGGEKLTLTSPVVIATATRRVARMSQNIARFGHGFASTNNVEKEIREALVASVPEGVTWRPYVLRAYCSTRLMLAEGAGRMTRDLREAILGHDKGISGRYNLWKPRGTEILKEARTQYKRAELYLLTSAKSEEGKENATRIIHLLLEARGVPTEELEKLDIGSMSEDEIVALNKTVGTASSTEKKAVPKPSWWGGPETP